METLLNDTLNQKLRKCILSSPRKKSQECKKVVVRPVIMKRKLIFQFEYHHEKKVLHENLSHYDANTRIKELLESSFKQINIFTSDEEIHVLASKPDRPHIKRKSTNAVKNNNGTRNNALNTSLSALNDASECALLSHDRQKNYVIKDGDPCDFLIRLGVMGKDGKVFKNHYSKFRQINRYLEIVDNIAEELIRKKQANHMLKIIDFGCGKAYLTFALYYYFHELKGQSVEITGLDLKKDVIDYCNKVADDLSFTGLTFKHGDIADYTDDGCDMVVTLHACDTATDYALINAVNWNAPVILSVPCCQHELFKQLENESLQPLLKHGLLKDRFTELITDALRGLALEACGYEVQMIEFTTLEHTMKNIMIRAVKRRSEESPKSKRALSEYNALKGSYGLSPSIDGLFDR